MGVSRYNSEGYYDPTAYEALTKISPHKNRSGGKGGEIPAAGVYLLPILRGHRVQYRKSKAVQPVCRRRRHNPHCAASAVPAVLIGRNGTGAGDFYGSGAAGQV